MSSRPTLPAPLLAAATQPYRAAGRFAWHFARGKLSMDPMFAGILANGWIPADARVLDLGCGQGLLASLLLAVDEVAAAGAWPVQWQPPPVGCRVHGLELMPRDVERARAALAAYPDRARVEQADIARTEFAESDIVTILDVLHYIPYAAQEQVLSRVYACLVDGGTLLLRVGDKAGGLPFRFSNWVDALVFKVRGHASVAMYCRTVVQWRALLEGIGFVCEVYPMHAGTPFASMMLRAKKHLRLGVQ
ncbi:MAG: methyltransferase [Brachymonas sp.]|nr:methyltransferase [Brachymonas sp.]